MVPLFSYGFKKEHFFPEIIFNFFLLKIYNITLDPDPNRAKILDPDPNSMYLDSQHCLDLYQT